MQDRNELEEQFTIFKMVQEEFDRVKKAGDLYEVLNLKRNCTSSDIKKAFYSWSIKYHPAKVRIPLADELFKVIEEAYQILVDQKIREKYDTEMDQYGSELAIKMIKDEQREQIQIEGKSKNNFYAILL